MNTDIITKQELQGAQRLLRQAQSVVILTHVSPDGDAMGSSLAMYHYLQLKGIETIAICTPNAHPDFLGWMPGANTILNYETNSEECKTIVHSADIAICLDFNDLKRINELGEQVALSPAKKLMIDHHLNPQDFADASISYPESPSTCELIFRLICKLGDFRLINTTIAECIYTGIMTDTGNFCYNSSNPDTFSIASELIRIGINKDQIYDRVFNTYTEDRMRLMGYCLYKNMRIFPENHTALIALSRKELYMFNFRSGDAEGIVNLPMQIADVHYSVLIREDTDKIKMSFRSQGNRPVNIYAAEQFNGGGHKNAAGGESSTTMKETIEKFENTFRQYFNK